MKFFFGLLFPIFLLVVAVRIVLTDMAVWAAIWSIYTLLFTVGGALVGTLLEASLKSKNKPKTGIDRFNNEK
jgi:hypothetical protein